MNELYSIFLLLYFWFNDYLLFSQDNNAFISTFDDTERFLILLNTLYIYRDHSGNVHTPPDTPSPGSKGTDPEDLDMIVSQPSLDVHLSLSEYWPGFSTVLVDVSPWCLMTNQTDLDLMIVEQNGTPWHLPSKKTFTPPKFKVSLSL